MSAWQLVYDAFDPDQEALREALCTLGNGYFASRGAAPECGADGVHYPGTYVAGCYNRLQTDIAGRTIENEDLVNCPNWLPLTFRPLGGEWLDLDEVKVLDYAQRLDLRQGILHRSLRLRDAAGRHTRLEERRLVSMDQPHLAALESVIQPEDWSGEVEVLSALDGRVVNDGVERYRGLANRHLEPLATDHPAADVMELVVQTSQSRVRIALAALTRLWRGDEPLAGTPAHIREDGYVAQRHRVRVSPDEPLRVEKVVALFTSRDHAISEPALEARKAVMERPRFADLAERHQRQWALLWKRFDFDIEHRDPDEGTATERILRLHVFHLVQTTSPHVMDLDVGVPARGLHGEAYRGHIFWDELFVFPLFNLRMPEITRALLRYRHRRLPEARRAAREAGLAGAMYPWQSGSNGREESQQVHLNPESGNWIPDNSQRQRHINAAVAYNVWQYYQVTRDMEFLSFYGAEMIFEIARFWASIASWDEARERYVILGVMGPDEYHDAYPGADEGGLDNNAYTNVMAAWVLLRALDLKDILPSRRFEDLCRLLGLSRHELDHWNEVSRRMVVPFHGDGIISQFEGYEDLEPFDWNGYRERYDDIQRLDRILEAEGDTPNRYQVSKQADVLMLFYLFSMEELTALFNHLGYDFDADTVPRNVEYYLARTSHGSTLSRVVHSWVLARANREGGWPLFREALESDVADIQGGTTEEGIHTGAMAGTVDLIQRCFTGIEVSGDVLRLNPTLPEELEGLSLNIRYRQHLLELHVGASRIRIATAPSGEQPMTLEVRGEAHRIGPGEVREIDL